MIWIFITVAALAIGVIGMIALALRGGLSERVPAARKDGDSMRSVLSVDLRDRDDG